MAAYTPKDGVVGLQLASGYTAGGTSFGLKTGQGAYFTTFPCRFTVITNASFGTGSGEILCAYTATGVSTDTLTGCAPIVGFTDQNFSANDYVEMRNMAEYIVDLQG